ncbi:MAG TPA: hypothetical protein PLL64_12210 [Rhodothermales bacterium]|nr:hypothetical protein [Rhodothermales bacterium]HRR10034.1 hypothetical protein [Rhodothermales bacterium]
MIKHTLLLCTLLLGLSGCDILNLDGYKLYKEDILWENLVEEQVVLIQLPEQSSSEEWPLPMHIRYMLFDRPQKNDRDRLVYANFAEIPALLNTTNLEVGRKYKITARIVGETAGLALRPLCELTPSYFPCGKGYNSIRIAKYQLVSIEPLP